MLQVTVGEPDAAVDLLEPIAEDNRMCVEYTHVSANVPASFAAPGIFPGLSLPKFGKKAREESGPKMRQVASFSCIAPLRNGALVKSLRVEYILDCA